MREPSVIREITVNPAELRFTQDSIACRLTDSEESIWDVLEKIRAGQISPEAFRKLQVVHYGGLLWSKDNRRLWLFLEAGCSQITVQLIQTHDRVVDVINNSASYKAFSRADFRPKVRQPPPGHNFSERSRSLHGRQNARPVVRMEWRQVNNGRTGSQGPRLSVGAPQLKKALEVAMDGDVSAVSRPESLISQKALQKATKPLQPSPIPTCGNHPAIARAQPSREAKVEVRGSNDHYIDIEDAERIADRWRVELQGADNWTAQSQSPLLHSATVPDECQQSTKSWFGWVWRMVLDFFRRR